MCKSRTCAHNLEIERLIIYGCTSRSRIFHLCGDVTIAGEGLQKFRPMLSAQGLWAGRDLYRATPAVTRDLDFPVSSEGPPHSVASYDTRGDVENLFYPGSSRVELKSGRLQIKFEFRHSRKRFVCLFICFLLSHTSNFSAIWRLSPLPVTGLQIFDLCLAFTAFSSEGSFTCHTYCDTWPPFLRSYPKDPWFYLLNTVLLAKKQSLPILYVLGLTRPARAGLELTTSHLLSESTTTRLRQPGGELQKQKYV
jgi:hypothetical protein